VGDITQGHDLGLAVESLAALLHTVTDVYHLAAVYQVSSLGDAESSLGDAKSSLADAKSSLGDAESSLG
jgi:hypothetical protein